MHSLLVIKDAVLAERPKLARDLYETLLENKRRYLAKLNSGEAKEAIDDRYRKQQKVVGADPLPHGVEANRPSLEALMKYAMQQQLLPKTLPIDDLFVKGL